MTRPRNPIALQLLIVLGVGLAVAGVVLHLALPAKYERVEIIPLAVGFAIALFAAAWLDPDRAKKAARAVTEAGGEVVHSVVELRTGDRKTDPVVRIEKTAPADAPDAPQAVRVTVTQEGGAPGPILPAPDEPPTGGFPPHEGR